MADEDDALPDVDFTLRVDNLRAVPRRMRDWSGLLPRQRDAIERMAALEAGEDPGEWDRSSMMTYDEAQRVRREVHAGYRPPPPRPLADIEADLQDELRFALTQVRGGRIYYALHDAVLRLLHERTLSERGAVTVTS